MENIIHAVTGLAPASEQKSGHDTTTVIPEPHHNARSANGYRIGDESPSSFVADGFHLIENSQNFLIVTWFDRTMQISHRVSIFLIRLTQLTLAG